MLEKPALPDALILQRLEDAYGLRSARLAFLPLGADSGTAVYRVDAPAPYFLKLRKGSFDELSVMLPRFLYDQGIREIIPPLATRAGQYWTGLEEYNLVLYPFIEGQDGYQVALPERRWTDFGRMLRRIHTLALPLELHRRLPRERYPSTWREMVRRYLRAVEVQAYDEPVAAKLAEAVRLHRDEIQRLVERADDLARRMVSRPLELVTCHTDIHAGNLLIQGNGTADGTAKGHFFLVDWDQPMLAPRERDLAFTGGGVGAGWNTPHEEALFYEGYGPVQVDRVALAYFRCERIVMDLAVECDLILGGIEGGDDREQSYGYFLSNFEPGGVLEIARRTDAG